MTDGWMPALTKKLDGARVFEFSLFCFAYFYFFTFLLFYNEPKSKP
jgi:hypothetical protein